MAAPSRVTPSIARQGVTGQCNRSPARGAKKRMHESRSAASLEVGWVLVFSRQGGTERGAVVQWVSVRTSAAPMVMEKPTRGGVSPGEQGEIDDLTLARARAGDEAARTAMVDRYQRRLYALVARLMVTRPELIDDLAQESFMKVLRGLPQFDPRGPARL